MASLGRRSACRQVVGLIGGGPLREIVNLLPNVAQELSCGSLGDADYERSVGGVAMRSLSWLVFAERQRSAAARRSWVSATASSASQ